MGVAFFYCDGNYPEKQDARYIFGSLLRQFGTIAYSTHKTDMKHLEALYQRTGRGGSLPLDVVLSMLMWMSRMFHRAYVVIDGLDECEIRKTLLSSLTRLAKDNLNILVTSRLEKDIEKSLVERPNMEMDNMHVQQDISAHIDWVLSTHENFEDIDDGLKNEIAQKLRERNNGMYTSRQSCL